jgi:CRISPR-associated protein Cmr6
MKKSITKEGMMHSTNASGTAHRRGHRTSERTNEELHSANPGYLFEKKMLKAKQNLTFDKQNLTEIADAILSYKIAPSDEVQCSDEMMPCCFSFCLQTTYPGFVTGTGRNHDIGGGYDANFKLGFRFDDTTGLPVIDGSSLKGALREPFDRFDYEGYDNDAVLGYFCALFNAIGLRSAANDLNADVIKGLRQEIFEGKDSSGNPLPMYKRDKFLDAYVVRGDDSDGNDGKIFSDDYITHHSDPLKDPNPVRFLRVRSNVTFLFAFECFDSAVIQELTAEKKAQLFKHIILEEGLGAKTSVGYGQFDDAGACEEMRVAER